MYTAQVRQTAGGPELVVAGGYCDGVLAEMQLFALNLSTWRWAWYPGLSTSPGCPAQLPTPCQRVGTLRLTQDWLLMLGGCPEQVTPRSEAGEHLCKRKHERAGCRRNAPHAPLPFIQSPMGSLLVLARRSQ